MVNCDCHQVKNTFEAKDLLNTFIQRTTMSRSSITFKPLTNWIRLDKTVSQTMPDAFVFYSRNYTQSIPHWVEQFCLEILKWESLIFILSLITISTLQYSKNYYSKLWLQQTTACNKQNSKSRKK